jgi:hypothetical protein
MENKLPIGFILDGIKIEQFAVIESAFKQESTVDLTATVAFGLDRENKRVRVVFSLNYTCEESPFIVLEIACFFSIKTEDFTALLDKTTASLFLPAGFARHLATLSVGTARGILHVKLLDTRFKDYVLPTINVSELVKEDVEFKA